MEEIVLFCFVIASFSGGVNRLLFSEAGFRGLWRFCLKSLVGGWDGGCLGKMHPYEMNGEWGNSWVLFCVALYDWVTQGTGRGLIGVRQGYCKWAGEMETSGILPLANRMLGFLPSCLFQSWWNLLLVPAEGPSLVIKFFSVSRRWQMPPPSCSASWGGAEPAPSGRREIWLCAHMAEPISPHSSLCNRKKKFYDKDWLSFYHLPSC